MERVYDDMPDFSELIATRLTQMQEETGLTAKDFAATIGLSESTLTRYKRGECTTDCDHAMSMLDILIENRLRYAELMIHFFPEESKVWEKVFLEHRFSGNDSSESIHSLVKKNPIYYYIYSLAGLDRGLPLDVITACWGLYGMELLQKLVDEGLLKVVDDIAVRERKVHTYGDLETVKQNIGYLAEDFPLSNIHEGTGLLINLFNNLNDFGIAALRALSKNYAENAIAILDNPEYRGFKPVSVSLLSGKIKNSNLYSSCVRDLEKQKDLKKRKKRKRK